MASAVAWPTKSMSLRPSLSQSSSSAGPVMSSVSPRTAASVADHASHTVSSVPAQSPAVSPGTTRSSSSPS